MENNPFPGSIGRICVHPCETACRRGQVDEPIAICALKRFADDQAGGAYQPKPPEVTKDKTVAVIGAGPSGLTAAHDLARTGYKTTVFEKHEKAGGMLRYGILNYRLPQRVLDKDIADIAAAGIEIKTGTAIGKDVSFSDINDRFDAVLIAVGLSTSRGIPLPGSDLEGVHYAVPFLESVNEGRSEELGNDVIVIGGGNVAVDVARSAKRLGCSNVKMVCLESREEMPAHDWEVGDAVSEGVEIHCSFGPHRIMGDNGRVKGLEFKEVDCVFDSEGRFNPTFHHDKKTLIDGDTVIFAIGQAGELDFLAGSGVELNERGQLIFDRLKMTTSLNGVFATGEAALGPGAAIEAIAAGHRAATAIDRYLETGDIVDVPGREPEGIAAVPPETKDLIKESKRQMMPVRNPEERLRDFDEIEEGFTVEAAVREAQRCLSCGAGAAADPDKCVACLTCVRVCPYEVPVVEGAVAYMDPAMCQSCGICAAECPAEAITVRLSEDHLINKRLGDIEKLFSGGKAKKKTVGFICQYGQMWANERLWKIDESDLSGVQLVDVLCLGRLSANQMLAAFEAGADRVFLMPCLSGNCHNHSGNTFAVNKESCIKEIVTAAGYDEDAFQVKPIGFGTSIVGTAKSVADSSLE